MSLQPGPDDRPDDSALVPPSPERAEPDQPPAEPAPGPEGGAETTGTAPPAPPGAEGATAWTAPPPPAPGGQAAPPPAAGWSGAAGPGQPPGPGAEPWSAPQPPYRGQQGGPAGQALPGYPQGSPEPGYPEQPAYGQPASGPAGYGQPGYGQAGYGQPGYAPGAYPYPPGYGVPRQTESKAVVALVLAIASWVVCPIILAIAALVLAGQSDRAIAASGGRLDGTSMNTATRWVAWANIVLWVIGIIIGAVFLTLAIANAGVTLDGSTQF